MRKKFSFIGINVLFNIPSLFTVYFILHSLCNISNDISTVIAIIFYIERVISDSKHDYLEHRIEQLEKRLPKE